MWKRALACNPPHFRAGAKMSDEVDGGGRGVGVTLLTVLASLTMSGGAGVEH